jgi:sugar lactone lactonase YvrE
MMKIIRFTILIIASLVFTTLEAQVTKLWETDALFSAPESVVFDAKRNCLYVNNFNDQGGFIKKADTLRNEFISKLDLQGNILDMKWIDNLHNPTGITIYNDNLYIAEREGVTIVNIETRKVEQRIPIDDAVFLNDIIVDSDGTIYVSDTFKPCVHRIKNGKSEVWYTDSLINSCNGLLIENNHLLVGNRGAENLLSISLDDKTTEVISNNLSDNIDGIQKCKDGYLLSWNAEFYSFIEGEKKLLYELDNKKDFFADFEYIEEQNLIIAPLLISNKVIALKMK